jgi:serine/threonine protein kinase
MRPLGHSDSDVAKYSNRSLAQVTLELRILTLDQLRGHAHLVNIRGVCYEESVADHNTVGLGQFHLILEYSQLGNIASFLRTNGLMVGIKAKIDLVRQVGCDLSILHEFHICHGDLKIQNVLIFNGKDGGYVAKLADFGMSIHSHESEIHYPSGTPLLNAPEIRNRSPSAQPVDIAAVIRADIFSFGLLMWEVITDGRSYFSPAWMDTDGASNPDIGVEEQMTFLSSLPRNGLLLRSEEFLLTQNLGNQLHQQILRVFHASLQDEPLKRQQISDILETMPMLHRNDR